MLLLFWSQQLLCFVNSIDCNDDQFNRRAHPITESRGSRVSLKQCHVGGNNVVISQRSPQNRGSVSNWRRIAFWIILDKEISEQKNVLGKMLHVVLRDVLIFVLWEWPEVTRQNCSTKDVIALESCLFLSLPNILETNIITFQAHYV